MGLQFEGLGMGEEVPEAYCRDAVVVVVYELVVGHDDNLLEGVIDLRERETFLTSFLVGIHLIS